MRTFYVTWEEVCETCNGKGHYYNPRWERINANVRLTAAMQAGRPESQQVPYPELAERYIKAEFGDGPEEPEEVWCEECEGEGKRRGRVPLAEALAEIEAVRQAAERERQEEEQRDEARCRRESAPVQVRRPKDALWK